MCRILSAFVFSTPDWIRTSNLRFRRPIGQTSKANASNELSQPTISDSHHIPTDTCHSDPDLTALIDAWDGLPEAIKAGILAMVKAATT